MVASTFGGPMSALGSALEEIAEQPSAESLDTFRKHLDHRWIKEALAATGVATLRKRRLPAEQVVWLALGMAMMRDRPIAEVVSRLDLALPGADGSGIVAPSSIVQARQRVGPEPLEWLFNKCAERWVHASARKHDVELLCMESMARRYVWPTPTRTENTSVWRAAGTADRVAIHWFVWQRSWRCTHTYWRESRLVPIRRGN